MMWLRKSKKGFTLIELMVVVAIIGVLALLGLRLFLMQQIRAKNAIVKANTATVHTIIQGNLADTDYSDAVIWAAGIGAPSAVADIRDDLGVLLTSTYGSGFNSERPAGMRNPHLTGVSAPDNLVVQGLAGKYATPTLFITAVDGLDTADPPVTYAGVVIVAEDTNITNKFYVIGLDNDAKHLGEVYIAMK